jgi:hypothetical protein
MFRAQGFAVSQQMRLKTIRHRDRLQDTNFLLKVPYIADSYVAVCLEVPNTGDMQDIPIKNMYANVGLDNSFEDMLKVNNKVNMSNFMRKGNEGTLN